MPDPLLQTKHFQVSRILSERVRYMVPGEALPTVAALKHEFDASQATIASALQRLRNQGLIEKPAGKKRLVVAAANPRTLFRVVVIRSLWSTPDYDAVVNAIYEAGHGANWGFQVYSYADVNALNLEHAIGDHDGAIILEMNANPPAHLRRALRRCGKPVVFLRTRPEEISSSLVWVDDRAVGRLATEHLLERGHRRILMLLSEPSNPSSSLRLMGWRDALSAVGERTFEEWVVDCSVKPGNDAINGSYQRLTRWLDGPPAGAAKFTAIVCAAWTGALAAMRALREHGLSVPEDVSVITYDSEAAFSEFLNPPLTTVFTDVKIHAREAIRLLRLALTHPQSKPETVLLPPELALRRSTQRVGPAVERSKE